MINLSSMVEEKGTDLGMDAPFFQKLVIRNWYCVPIWDGGVNTSGYTERRVGTRLVSIQNWYPPPLLLAGRPKDITRRKSLTINAMKR